MKLAKTAQYHDATNDTRDAKQFSTIISVITAVLSFFHGISHEICHLKAQYHDARHDTRDAKQLSTFCHPQHPPACATRMTRGSHILSGKSCLILALLLRCSVLL